MMQGSLSGSHKLLLVLLWVQVPLLATLGLLAGESLFSVGIAALLLMVYAIAGMLISRPLGASIVVAVGLVTSSVVLAAYVPAEVAALHFLAMISAISIYRMWQPLLAGVVAVVGYYFIDAVTNPEPGDYVASAIPPAFAILIALVLVEGWRQPGREPADAATTDHLRVAFEKAPLGMAILRPSGEVLQVNAALGRLLEYEPEALQGRNIRSFVHSDDMTVVGEAWEEMGNTDDHSTVAWLRCSTASGGHFWGRVSLSLLPQSENATALVILQVEDASRSYQEKRELLELLQGKDQFVAAVGEEIGEPLHRIVDLASGDEPGSRSIRGHAYHIAVMVSDLIVSARANGTSRPAASLPIDAGTLCHDVVAWTAGDTPVAIETGAEEIWADPTLTRQVLAGLVGNAIRFGGANVAIKSYSSGPDTVVEVVDDGPEIPTSERDRVFESDLQHGTPRTKPAVVGLGLTVGRRLARQMDGDLSYRRTADGENVFELRLPSEQFVSASNRRELDVSV